MASTGVARRLSLALALVLAFAFGLIGFLAYEKQRKAYGALVHARVLVLALDLGAAADAGVNMGLPLAAMSNLQALFQRAAAEDEDILSIDAFDPAGRILHSSDPKRIGAAVPAAWLPAAGAERRWRVDEPDAFVSGLSLRNSFDAPEGAIAVRYDRRGFDAALDDTARELAWRIGLVFLVCAGAAAAGARFVLRGAQ